MKSSKEEEGTSGSYWPLTRHTIIDALKNGTREEQDWASELLAELYQEPIRIFAKDRFRNMNDHDIDEIVQEVQIRLHAKEYLKRYDESGKLRSFIIPNIIQVGCNLWNKKKRKGEVELDPDAEMAKIEPHQREVFDRGVARSILGKVRNLLDERCKSETERELMVAMYPYLEEGSNPPYAELAGKFNRTEATLSKAFERLRKNKFQKRFQEVLAATVPGEADLHEEMRYLLTLIANDSLAS